MDNNDMFDIYRFMIESSRDIVFLLDNNDRFIFLNDRIETLLGFTKNELLGKHFSSLIHPDDMLDVKPGFCGQNIVSMRESTRSIELRFTHKQDCTNFRYFDVKLQYVPANISEKYNDVLFNNNINDKGIRTYGVARDISHLKSFENIINANVNYDYLTGLPNRSLLKDRMKQAIAYAKRENCNFAVMFFDLDGFKQVNDIFGHSSGDIVLQSVSARMKACLREVDTLARVGGDEFILILPEIHETMKVRTIADKLLKEINKPFIINGNSMPVSASIGIALYPDNGETFDALINGADRAMYHIKHRTKNDYAFLSELNEINNHGNVFSFS